MDHGKALRDLMADLNRGLVGETSFAPVEKALRSLALSTVDVALLRDTGAGKEVNALRRHSAEVVRNAATAVVSSWRQQIADRVKPKSLVDLPTEILSLILPSNPRALSLCNKSMRNVVMRHHVDTLILSTRNMDSNDARRSARGMFAMMLRKCPMIRRFSIRASGSKKDAPGRGLIVELLESLACIASNKNARRQHCTQITAISLFGDAFEDEAYCVAMAERLASLLRAPQHLTCDFSVYWNLFGRSQGTARRALLDKIVHMTVLPGNGGQFDEPDVLHLLRCAPNLESLTCTVKGNGCDEGCCSTDSFKESALRRLTLHAQGPVTPCFLNRLGDLSSLQAEQLTIHGGVLVTSEDQDYPPDQEDFEDSEDFDDDIYAEVYSCIWSHRLHQVPQRLASCIPAIEVPLRYENGTMTYPGFRGELILTTRHLTEEHFEDVLGRRFANSTRAVLHLSPSDASSNAQLSGHVHTLKRLSAPYTDRCTFHIDDCSLSKEARKTVRKLFRAS